MQKFLLLLILFISTSSFGQFPEGWLGHYGGTMHLSNGLNPIDSLEVSLDILEVKKDSVWTYTMHYYSEKYGSIEKNYHIVRSNDGLSYQMDELNGIKIDMSYLNNCFYEFFEVDNMLYATTMRQINGGILFEIFGSSNEPSNETDSQPDENNTVYKVFSMKPTFAQSVLLLPVE
jgi:hypothetical protein